MRTALAVVLTAGALTFTGSTVAQADSHEKPEGPALICPRPVPGESAECFEVEVSNCVTPEGEVVAQVCVNLTSNPIPFIRNAKSICTERPRGKRGRIKVSDCNWRFNWR